MGLHVFPILIPTPTSFSTQFLQVFPVYHVQALVSCIQPGLLICFTLDNIRVSMLFWEKVRVGCFMLLESLPLCLYHNVFVTVTLWYSLKSGRIDSSRSIPLSQHCFGSLRFFFHKNCGIITYSSLKNTNSTLIGIALNTQVALGIILIFTICILLICEHSIFLHLFVSTFISFISVL